VHAEQDDASDCIEQFEDVVREYRATWFAPISALPCPKERLLTALLRARDVAYPDDLARRQQLIELVADLTWFIPDEDLATIEPFLNAGGRITPRAFADPGRNAQRDHAYHLLEQHRAEREKLLPGASAAPIGQQRDALRIPTPSVGAGLELLLGPLTEVADAAEEAIHRLGRFGRRRK
jgi:hypothetical protein